MLNCTKCKQSKSDDEMSLDRSRRSGISSWCKLCRKESARKWKIVNPDKAEVSRLNRISKYREAPPN